MVTKVKEIGLGTVPVCCVHSLIPSPTGIIEEGSGFVTFPVAFKAIVFRPFKGEVVNAVVTQVNKVALTKSSVNEFSLIIILDGFHG